jgi:N6-adenosine-specific RNA methylase IME4
MKYRTIVADPPWAVGDLPIGRIPRGAAHDGRKTPTPYSCMGLEEISQLPVASLAQTSAHLYLWTINSYIPDAYEIARAWGFKPSTLLVWAKTPMGLAPGGTWASNVEYVLFARRGSLPTNRRYDSRWFNWPRTTVHSKKPDAFMDMVEMTSPGPYLELFARRNRLGWDTWGNEALEMVEL